MNLDFSADQKSLRDHAQRFLRETCGSTQLRASLDGDQNFPTVHWQSLCEQGWPGMSVPEAQGGLGLGPLEVCVIMEELGRALSPSPFFSTVCLGVETLRRLQHPDALKTLERIAVDGLALAVQINPEHVQLRIEADRISGSVSPLRDALSAGQLLALATDEDQQICLVLVELNDPGVSRQPLKSIDQFVEIGDLQFDNAPATVLLAGQPALQAAEQALNRAAVFAAFEQIGGAEAACHLAREYALTRYTFGRPIGGYQAIKHKLADMLVKIELARSNAFYGAWAVTQDAPELPQAAAVARISACEAYEFTAEECLHLHGGIGYTWEADCHFYYKRSRLLALLLDGPTRWSQRLLANLAH